MLLGDAREDGRAEPARAGVLAQLQAVDPLVVLVLHRLLAVGVPVGQLDLFHHRLTVGPRDSRARLFRDEEE